MSTKTTIGELIARDGGNIKTGPFGTALKANEYTNVGVPLISVGEIGYGTFKVADTTPRVPPDVTSRLPEYVLREGDIVFGRKGAVDRSARVGAEQDGWFLGSDGIRLRLPATIDSKFVAYQLQSVGIREWILQHAIGTTMASLNQGVIERIPIVLPPLLQQRRIAHVLGALDDKAELLRRMEGTLEGICRALFQQWFVDFEPVRAKAAGRIPRGISAEVANVFPSTFEDSPLGVIPAGWRSTTLGAEATRYGGVIQTGPFGSQLHASDYVSDGVPVVMPKDIVARRVSTVSIARIRESDAERLSRHRMVLGDVVYSRRGDVERHALVGAREVGWLCGTGCLLVRLGSRWPSPIFASLALDRPELRAWISQHAIGATMPNLNTTILSAVPLVVPPDHILHAFESLVRPLQDRMDALNTERATLFETRDTLLPKLLAGGVGPLTEGGALSADQSMSFDRSVR